ncbi:unnamed protein product [Protopolystoma xenopodis]|uniref:Uncharacterized protein n=1 Tax=Protopolystoma xenopodis TaxID=117903 RepID=A0A448WTM0_9PLAT|nr:unnamed protein product [Protopolystoma xenopodis]
MFACGLHSWSGGNRNMHTGRPDQWSTASPPRVSDCRCFQWAGCGGDQVDYLNAGLRPNRPRLGQKFPDERVSRRPEASWCWPKPGWPKWTVHLTHCVDGLEAGSLPAPGRQTHRRQRQTICIRRSATPCGRVQTARIGGRIRSFCPIGWSNEAHRFDGTIRFNVVRPSSLLFSSLLFSSLLSFSLCSCHLLLEWPIKMLVIFAQTHRLQPIWPPDSPDF